jgi:ribosomal protein S18 acetylase RimI-like enzyme
MDEFQIVLYSPDYLDGLASLIHQWGIPQICTPKSLAAQIQKISGRPDSRIYIALYKNRVVGYAQTTDKVLLCFDPFVEVEQLLVDEDCRSMGIGSVLMRRIEADALAGGMSMVKLSSQVHRTRAHLFYERMGYEFFKISKFYEKKI